jgi:phenylacetate-CoA ligase
MTSFYNHFLGKLLLPVGDILTKNRVMYYYKLYSDLQWHSREQLKVYQNNQFIETLKTTYNEVPFYRELYDSNGIPIEKIKGTNDLPQLPVVTKDALRRSYPAKCTRDTKWPWREYCSSGSTGRPFAVRVDNETMSMARALMFLRANYSGWNIGDPFLQTGMTLERGVIKKFKDRMLRVEYSSAFDMSDQVLDIYLDLIDRKNLDYIMGYAGSLNCIAARASEVNFNRPLKGIVSWGDNLYDHYRRKIESAFKCRVTDTYGCGEGIQIAAQCGRDDGAYHIFTPHVVVEVVDEDGNSVAPGEVGNILLTRLHPGAMPLIRYRVGDIGVKSPDEACPCGRGLELLASVDGRDTDIILTPNGNRLIVHFFTGIFEYYQSINTFKVIQEKSGEIIVELVPNADFREEHWTALKNEILEKGDPDLNIHLKLVNEIPLEKSNKRRFVISRLNDIR